MVKKYVHTEYWQEGGTISQFIEDDRGDWVRASDYETAESHLRALRAYLTGSTKCDTLDAENVKAIDAFLCHAEQETGVTP